MKLSRAKVIGIPEKNNSCTLYIMGDYPTKKDVQLDIYVTLEELKHINTLFLQEFPLGEIPWASRLCTLTNFEELTEFYGDISTDLEGPLYSKWTRAPSIFGYHHRGEVRTYGVETVRFANEPYLLSLEQRLGELSLKHHFKGESSLSQKEKEDFAWMNIFVENFIRETSKELVDNSLAILEQTEHQKGILVARAEYCEALAGYLKKERVSYAYVEPCSFSDYTVTIPSYLIERIPGKQKTFKQPSKKRKK